MVGKPTWALFTVILLQCGCSSLTEYEILYEAGLNVYSPVDLQHLRTIEIDPDARCLTVSGETVYLGCTDGYARSYSIETLDLLGEIQAGQPSPSGYLDMEYCEYRSSLYLTGAAGTVVEISLPQFEVTDEFSPCATPVELEITQGDPGYLWVVDRTGNSVHQIHLDTNGHCGSVTYSAEQVVAAIEASIYPDSLLVGTSYGFFRLDSQAPGVLRSSWMKGVYRKCMALTAIPGDSNFIAVLELTQSSSEVGELCAYDDSAYVSPPERFYNSVSVPGDVFLLESGTDGDYVYFLTSGDPGESVLGAYRTGEEYAIETQVEVPGNPLDLTVSETGEVYVLTYM